MDDLLDRLRHQVERATDPIDPSEVGTSLRRPHRSRTLNMAAVFALLALVVGVVALRSDQPEDPASPPGPEPSGLGLSVERIVAPDEADGAQVVLIELDGELPDAAAVYVDDITSVDAPGLAYALQDMTETVWVCDDRHSGFGPGAVGQHSVDVLIPVEWLDPGSPTVPFAPAADGVSGSWAGKILGCGPYKGYVQYSIWGVSADPGDVRVTVDGDTIRVVVQAPEATTTTTTSTTTPTTVEVDADEAGARAFIDAWRRGDADTMRQVGGDEQVDVAIGFGTAVGEPECSSQPGGQYECVVSVSSGTRVYLLVGEPGAQSGRVWWLAEYVPGT
jgi:hypothetical protein